jgi:hypothetical protein
MLNKDVLAHDPSSFTLADGGVAKVSFPPEPDQKAILREQLQTFVCDGAYAEALRRMLEAFNAAAGRRADVPAAWISGFYGSGKSLLAAMLGALWVNLKFDDGAIAEGLVPNMPSEVRAALRELRANGKRLGGLLVGGSTLGRGAQHPVKAILDVVLSATGLPSGGDLRPPLAALWLEEQGILGEVRAYLGTDFDRAAREFLLDDSFATAALSAKPSLAPDVDNLMDRFGRQFEREPEPTVALLVDTARKALMVGRNEMPLTLILLDEVQQFIREDSDLSLTIQTIAEELCSKFRGRVFLVATGQSALGDVRYLEKLLTRFVVPVPLGSADINSVIRKTVLLKKDTAKPEVERMLELRSGEIDKHLQGSNLKHSAADRQFDVADWPMLASRRRFWERVLAELDRSGLGATLRGQLRISLDAVKRYGDRSLGVAVAGDFLFDTFAAEAMSRNLILREVSDRIALLRAEPGDGPLKARLLILRGGHRGQRRVAAADQGECRVAIGLRPLPGAGGRRCRPHRAAAHRPPRLGDHRQACWRRSDPAWRLENAAADRAGSRRCEAQRRRPGVAPVERLGPPAGERVERHQGGRCRERRDNPSRHLRPSP